MLYIWKVKALKVPRVNYWWRYWRGRRGTSVGAYNQLSRYIRQFAPGKTFADIGCMWGVNGEHAFQAEEAGATRVVAVDVFGPTPEFDERHRAAGSRVEFILGDISAAATLERIGQVDVVFCAGVLYHHPSPFDLLVALRRICRETLILRTSTIPEVRGFPNAAVFFPMLDEQSRELWNLQSLGLAWQAGITTPFKPEEGYGNWFWGLTPSCLVSMLRCAGFEVTHRAEEAFAQTVVATPVATAFAHHLPDERAARDLGSEISRAQLAKPA